MSEANEPMDWLMSKIYTAVKGFVVVTTAGCSIAVFTGLSSSVGAYVLGSLIGVAALFLAFDTFGMATALAKLNKENDRLHQSNNDYMKLNLQHESSIKNLNDANTSYINNNKALSNQIDLLTGQAARFQASIASLNQNNQMLQSNISTLQDQNMQFKSNNLELQKHTVELQTINTELQKQTADFKINNQTLEQQTKDLQKINQELSTFGDQQKRQIDSLRLVQAQSKQLIQALMTAGDDFKEFQSTLTDSMNRIENTSDAMTLLLDKLTTNQFRTIDTNNDGSITRDELQSWSKHNNQI